MNSYFNYRNPELIKTQEWMNSVIKCNFPKLILPSWVKIEEFYDNLRKQIFSDLRYEINKGGEDLYVSDLFFQLTSTEFNNDVELESEKYSIPHCVIKEFISKGYFECLHIENKNIPYYLENLKDDDTEFRYVDKSKVNKVNNVSKQANTISGLMKPVKISQEMAEFCGWNPDEFRSRVEVTKHLSNYIKDHNLQHPNNKTEIIPDQKLSTLLDYSFEKDNQPLTYYLMQKKIVKHFASSDKISQKMANFCDFNVNKLNSNAPEPTTRKTKNTVSDLMKPVKISQKIAEFCGWNLDELRSRVDVTKYICNYISENNLQNYQREIIPDQKLATLLDYNIEMEKEPLTHFLLQKKIAKHFENEPETV